MKINRENWEWTRKPKDFTISEEKIEIITNPHTDLWQRTYYHFRNARISYSTKSNSCGNNKDITS